MSVVGAAAGMSIYEDDWGPNAHILEQYNQMMPNMQTPFQQQKMTTPLLPDRGAEQRHYQNISFFPGANPVPQQPHGYNRVSP